MANAGCFAWQGGPKAYFFALARGKRGLVAVAIWSMSASHWRSPDVALPDFLNLDCRRTRFVIYGCSKLDVSQLEGSWTTRFQLAHA